jgi:hypothetical protein
VATDEDTAVATSPSINKQPSTQIAVTYKELLPESDDPCKWHICKQVAMTK